MPTPESIKGTTLTDDNGKCNICITKLLVPSGVTVNMYHDAIEYYSDVGGGFYPEIGEEQEQQPSSP